MKPFLTGLAFLCSALIALPAAAACDGARLVLLPFEAVALSRPETRETEDAVRRALSRTPGVCLEPRARTVERLRALGTGGRLSPCEDAGCRSTQVALMEADALVRGRAFGLGGERTVTLVLVERDGSEARRTWPVTAGDAEESSLRAFGALWEARHPVASASRLGPWPKVMMGVGAAALVAGVGFGLAARSTERELSTGTGGCTGEGEAFRRCFSERLSQGERQSTVSNTLLGAGALLGAGGAVLFVWELP